MCCRACPCEGNAELIIRGVRAAHSQGADLAVTQELALMGYLPRDLLTNEGFVRRSSQLYLMCDDLKSEMAALQQKGIQC